MPSKGETGPAPRAGRPGVLGAPVLRGRLGVPALLGGLMGIVGVFLCFFYLWWWWWRCWWWWCV